MLIALQIRDRLQRSAGPGKTNLAHPVLPAPVRSHHALPQFRHGLPSCREAWQAAL